MPGFVGFPEILLLGLVVLLVFGPKRLPEMGRSLGKGLREFKDSVTNNHEDKLDEPSAAIAEPVSFAHLDETTAAPKVVKADPRPFHAENKNVA